MKYRILPREAVNFDEYPTTYTIPMNEHAGKIVDVSDEDLKRPTITLFGYYWIVKWMVPVSPLPSNFIGSPSGLIDRRQRV